MKKLYYLGQAADGYGWGVCNANLQRALASKCDLTVCPDPNRHVYDAPVFIPVADASLNPLRRVSSPFTIGYTFFEYPLRPDAARNARQYDVIFGGSAWNTDALKPIARRAETLVQGVDFDRFKPQPWEPDRKGFRVFSGGKFEYRKGQDIVIAALASFMKMHNDVVLISQWSNPWPATAMTMGRSNYIDMKDPLKNLPKERVISRNAVPNEAMPALYQQADIGLFPNRCEGGTNLVLMEFMACGRPVIANAKTGHADILTGQGPLYLKQGDTDFGGWWHGDVSDCLVQLEYIYGHRDQLKPRGDLCRKLVEPWTWDRAAETILSAVPG